MVQKKKGKSVRHKNTPGFIGVRAKKKTPEQIEGSFSRTRRIFTGLVFIFLAVCTVGFYPTPYTFSKSVAIPFTTTQKDSGDLELGDSKVSVEGSEGSKIIEISAQRSLFGVLFRWEPQNQSEKSSVVTKKPVDKVVVRGTKKYQYMLCSDGSYRYYTDEQFKDSNTGFTSKSADTCAENNQGYKVGLADSKPSNSASSTTSSSAGGVSYEAQKIQRETEKIAWCSERIGILGDEYISKVHHAQNTMEYGSEERNNYIDGAYWKYSLNIGLLKSSGCAITSPYPDFSQ